MKAFEREFLKHLAATWLAARWRVMGHSLTGVRSHGKGFLPFDLLGMVDYAAEMRLLCQEAKCAPSK